MKIRTITLFIVTATFMATQVQALMHSPDADDNQQDKSQTIVLAMVEEFNWQGSLEYYLNRLKDPDPFTRVKAVQALGEVRNPLSLQALLLQLHDNNFYVRAYTAEALAKIGKIDIALTAPKLIPSLKDQEPYVRAMTAKALGELRVSSAIEPLTGLLDDDHEMVRQQANWALKEIDKVLTP